MADQTVARVDPRRDIVSWINSDHIAAEVKRAIPSHVPVDWFLRCAQTALLNNPNLAKAEKASLLRELVAVAQLGLVLDPQLGEAWLIIDGKGTVQRRVGYQGLRKLALQSGLVNALNAQAVYTNDVCEISLGDSPSVTHKIDVKVPERGEIVGYYAVARIVGTSEPVVEWMSQKQVEAHRDRYSDSFRYKSGPWADPLGFVEMARKTVFRRLAKWLPKSPLLADALSHEDREDMRDITPGASSAGMLPAPVDDPMDNVVAQARQEPTPPRKPAGRPKKPETIAREIIADLNACDPADVQDYMLTREEDIAALPQELQNEIGTAAQDRVAEVAEGQEESMGTGEVFSAWETAARKEVMALPSVANVNAHRDDRDPWSPLRAAADEFGEQGHDALNAIIDDKLARLRPQQGGGR